MRKPLFFAVASALVFAGSSLIAQVPPAAPAAVDPDVVGPARRAAAAAADAAGAPGVEQRIEQREERRDAERAARGNPNAAARNQARATDPEAWRMRWHNNQWWYYTPRNTWMYYRDNNWSDYDANTYVAPRGGYYYTGPRFRGRYYSGYRGAFAPPATRYSNGTPAGNLGTNLGADIGAAANGAAGANTGAAVGGAIGNAVGNPNNAAPTNSPPPGGTNPSPSTQPKLNQNYQHAPRLDEDANPRPNPNPNPSSNPNPVPQPNP